MQREIKHNVLVFVNLMVIWTYNRALTSYSMCVLSAIWHLNFVLRGYPGVQKQYRANKTILVTKVCYVIYSQPLTIVQL